MAERTLLAKSSSPREAKREYSADGEDGCGNALVDGRDRRPSPLARVRHAPGVLTELRGFEQSGRGQVQQP